MVSMSRLSHGLGSFAGLALLSLTACPSDPVPSETDDSSTGGPAESSTGGPVDPSTGDGTDAEVGTGSVTSADTGTGTEPGECGDGIVDPGEECDDGGESARCDADCTVPECGDGVANVAAGEDCDDRGESATCNDDCTAAACGDGTVNMSAGETCDDGGKSPGCDADCTFAECGDGVFNPNAGELCDEGGATAMCDGDCTPVSCGDGVVNVPAGEDCDDGGESAACNVDCSLAMCGDGVTNVTAGEDCDDMGESMLCNADCTPAMCGDGFVNVTAGEDCDDMGQSATCDTDCTPAMCGDGVTNFAAGEQCDDGNMVDDDNCSNLCESDLLPNVLLCGSSSRDVTSFFPPMSSLNLVVSCVPDGNTQAMLISRSGVALYNPADLVAYVNAGGLVLTEVFASDDVFSDLFEIVAEGPFTGSCLDRAPIVFQYNAGDQFWLNNAFNPIPLGDTGCGTDVSAFPGITPLVGWNNATVSIAYRDLGAGRLWLTDFDWQDTDTPEIDPTYADTNSLMGYMLTTGQ